jgi:hypothetical protein
LLLRRFTADATTNVCNTKYDDIILGGMAQAPETKVVLRVEPSLKQQAERIAEQRDETLSQVLRRALREYVREHAQTELPLAGQKTGSKTR